MITEQATHKLISLKCVDFRRVEFFEIDPEGKHVIVRAPHSQGKSTLCQALASLFDGQDSKKNSQPVRHGQSKATLEACVGTDAEPSMYNVKEVFSAATGKMVLTVTRNDGKPMRPAREFLDSLRLEVNRDPLEFLGKRKQDQLADVLEIAGRLPPVDAVQTITGERHPCREGESAYDYLARLAEDESGIYYHRRREAGRVLTQKTKALSEATEELRKVGGPLAEHERPHDPTETIQRISELQASQQERNRAIAEAADADKEVATAVKLLDSVRQSRDAACKEIERLNKLLAEKQVEHDALEKRLEAGKGKIAELKEYAATLKAEVALLPDKSQAIEVLRDTLAICQTATNGLEKRRAMESEVGRLAGEELASRGEHERLEVVLAAIRDLRLHLLDDVDLGVSGLSVGDGELMLNGHPFSQAGKAESIVTSVLLTTRRKPRPAFPFMWLDDGEHLDKEMRELLFETAGKEGWQVFMTAVADTGEGLAVEFVEGG